MKIVVMKTTHLAIGQSILAKARVRLRHLGLHAKGSWGPYPSLPFFLPLPPVPPLPYPSLHSHPLEMAPKYS